MRAEIRHCLDKWKEKDGNLIMILHEIQNRHGYVPRGASLFLAQETGVAVARIYEVLTFYHYFRLVPPGKHNLTVCNGTACYLKGSGRVLGELERRLGISEGKTTSDRLFHLETVRCIGYCAMAPAMVVDGKAMGKLTTDDVASVVEKIRKREEGESNGQSRN
ncbi:MAG: NAD(P)H-dependent oxidoreductase subunit E [Puniceicoccaceae bacterium]|nr:MAG: NAD(P)H-dependent oxidoreductase subunit E [Puniceicoccaceae bacterium]